MILQSKRFVTREKKKAGQIRGREPDGGLGNIMAEGQRGTRGSFFFILVLKLLWRQKWRQQKNKKHAQVMCSKSPRKHMVKQRE